MPDAKSLTRGEALKCVEQIYRERLELIIVLRNITNWHDKLGPGGKRAPSLFSRASAFVHRIDHDMPHHYQISQALKEKP